MRQSGRTVKRSLGQNGAAFISGVAKSIDLGNVFPSTGVRRVRKSPAHAIHRNMRNVAGNLDRAVITVTEAQVKPSGSTATNSIAGTSRRSHSKARLIQGHGD